MNDFQLNKTDSVIGVFPEYFIENDILAIIPITSAPFTSNFDSGANFIYKTRNYNSPVDIGKISIKMLNMDGIMVDLHSVDFSFVLQVTTICDNMVPYKPNAVSVI